MRIMKAMENSLHRARGKGGAGTNPQKAAARIHKGMAIHTLERTQTIRCTLEECWKFFSDPRNLARITPPELGFEVISTLPERMHAGLMIEYRVRPLFGVPMTWLTEITHVDEPHAFVDEQRIGPYKIWHHEHRFLDGGNGTVTMLDKVTYVLPFALFGEIAHPLLVAPQLERIFEFRTTAAEGIFGRG
jgi:ligand-binding SRPBCC domain-containing protein